MSGEILAVRSLSVRFGAIAALEDVSFDLMPAQTLGLVGESGSGKSTLARAILRLGPIARGQVLLEGTDLGSLRPAELRRRRRDLQIVFQDPLASLNPRMSVGAALAEPLEIFEPGLSARARSTRVAAMLERVGLTADAARRRPQEFSGGQCQRIGIARAMMLQPKLLICDEPVSSLDVSVRGQIVNLLADLQRERGMAMLFISHDLAVVRHLSHRVLVMYRGRLVETASCDALFAAPAHPYTRALLAAVPQPLLAAVPQPYAGLPRQAPPIEEDLTAERPADGCAFHPRCIHARDSCLQSVPALQRVAAGHFAACHRWSEVVYS
jgi:oligopeptide transport system ATP-binding protein